MTVNDWLDRLAPKALALVAAGTCATYGGIHAMAGNPTGAMGVADYLGWTWKSKAGIPIVNIPGCPTHPDNFAETLLYLLYQAAGAAPMIPLDDALRPTWLFGATVHEGCDRAGYYEQGDFATEYGSPKCIVKLGCWGPVVKCNVPKRGWVNGVGGCPNVGGICIGCTMPGFPDKFMPFMDEPPGSRLSTGVTGMSTARLIRRLRAITAATVDKEPEVAAQGPGAGHRLHAPMGVTDRSTRDPRPRGDRQETHGHRRSRDTHSRDREPRRDGLGPDHPDRRQPRASTRRSTGATRRSSNARARRRSSAATASS